MLQRIVDGRTDLVFDYVAQGLRMSCYDGFDVRSSNVSSYDHGSGWEQPAGRPHVEKP